MSFLLAIFQRYGYFALFIFCEIIAFVLIVNFNQKQKDIFLHSSSIFAGSLLKRSAILGDYLTLQDSNEDLLNENARLLNEIISMPRPAISQIEKDKDSYDVIPSRIINNSIASQRNHFTIDKGSADSVFASMGVITAEGVVGIVKRVSKNYATVLSLLNLDIRISASIDQEDFFGTITWDGASFRHLKLTGIPTYANIKVGDKIITNGFSTIFPHGIEIGTVSVFDISKNGAFYNISVVPTTDFSNMGHVYILKGDFAEEIISLEADE